MKREQKAYFCFNPLLLIDWVDQRATIYILYIYKKSKNICWLVTPPTGLHQQCIDRIWCTRGSRTRLPHYAFRYKCCVIRKQKS